MHDEPIRNPMRERPLSDFIDAKLNRRDLLKAGGKLGMAAAFAGLLKPTGAFAHTPGVAPALTFKEIAKSTAATHHVAPGYDVSLLIRWGDSIKADAPKFNPYAQSVDAQLT
ncbi:MAG: alkaline phosphatase PhoX, partial [Rickettsiales bacterium]